MKRFLTVILSVIITLPFLGFNDSQSKTRWSSIHCIPDADLLSGGKLLLDIHNFTYSDYLKGYKVKPSALVTLGIIECINLEAGYAGGGIIGFKARILGETKKVLPSMAVGIHNVFSHKEAYNYGYSPDSMSNEIYVAFAKGVEGIKLRFHLGVQTIPGNDNEKVNPFFGLEKYFGNGLYISIEAQRRDKHFNGSIFGNYRFLKRKVELCAGLIDIAGLQSKNKDKFTLKLANSGQSSFTRPGIYVGLRFLGSMRWGKSDGFISLEERIARQNESYQLLQNEVDSLKNILKNSKTRIDNMDQTLKSLSDSSENDYYQLKKTILQKLITVKTLYEEEPFEPEKVKKSMQEIISYRDKVIPVLQEIAMDRKESSQIRVYAVSVMSELGSRSAADALIEILAQAQHPEMKIEALIGLGKIKEMRARYLMQQLANDPNDGVAFTATEILTKLEKETGIKLVQDKAESVPEK
ncbi:MAG TPA: HEAT repeat domain-containing protein, partial [Chitinispirillaceae bacterium]|nr:HEAT repeat domain-containing protein [Chitinispirillaceae bacterium]